MLSFGRIRVIASACAALTVAVAAPDAFAQGPHGPPIYREVNPGPRVEQAQVRAEIRWIDHLLGKIGNGYVLLSAGVGPDGEEYFMPVRFQDLVAMANEGAASGLLNPNVQVQAATWATASLQNTERLRARREALIRRDSELAALIRDPARPPTLQPWELGRRPVEPGANGTPCVAEGVWSNRIKAGASTWTIAADGTATESGMGNARGKAVMSGDTLVITWRTGAIAGTYRIDVFSNCSGGDGEVSFSDGPPGFDRSSQPAEFTRVSGPAGGAPKN